MVIMKNVTVLVMGCDEYVDVSYISAYYKKKYWEDCPYEYCLVTQTEIPENGAIFDRIYTCPAEYNWMQRLDSILNEIDTDYILLMCDDFFPYKKIREIDFEKYIKKMEECNIGLIKIFPFGNGNMLEKVGDGFWKYNDNSPFRISYCVGLWKKNYLMKFTPCHMNAWRAEYENSIQSLQYPEAIFATDEISPNSFIHGVMSGMWQWDAYYKMKKDGVPKAVLGVRKKKKIKFYIKDIVYNIAMRICPNTLLDIQHKFNVGRGL